MSGPIVFISKNRIKEGKLEAVKEMTRQGAQFIEANKPGTLAFLVYISEDGAELNIVHVFPDAQAMELHMEGAGDRAKAAYELMEPEGFEIYGKPSDGVLEIMKQAAGMGVSLSVKPEHVSGYIRYKSG